MEILQLSDYHIYIGTVAESLTQYLNGKKYSRYIVLCDENTEKHCLPILEKHFPNLDFLTVKIPDGEAYKNIDTCQSIWRQLMVAGIDRKALMLNLGGGVIGDMGGFCASTFKRGIDFVQIPTTLLSQVDASIGGKLGIDFASVKNSIGLFCNPKAVLIDPEFLKTLSKRELRSGFAEIIKHALIADAAQWQEIEKLEVGSQMSEEGNWEKFIVPSLKIKQRIVEEDPFEKGIRKALNFGHTIGHAVESLFLESDEPLLHGEAIAIGMVCESWLSHKILGLPQENLQSITTFLTKWYGRRHISEKDFGILLDLMQNDKKNERDRINFTLINPIGNCVIDQYADAEAIFESMRYYNDAG
ncbi:MAG: 3-dehydroquinate synthase [Saprospiraceae bacterium]